MKYIKFLSGLCAGDLGIAGGKAANLGALICAGLPVPPGFCILTEAYKDFVLSNNLQEKIKGCLKDVKPDDTSALEAASTKIRELFYSGITPDQIILEIKQAYTSKENPLDAVAVRSSATAEDLPDMSFAGQQDTYLNIIGEQALLDSVKACWASLWTARAISYRGRNKIDHAQVTLAVVVQQMVQSQSSGVLFTANPLNGKRTETVIDAVKGLGEALVSGLVEPDHYVVDILSNTIIKKTLGARALSIHGKPGGGTVTVNDSPSSEQAISDDVILDLCRLGGCCADYFKCPQDMEWAYNDGKIYVVQSRPITSLYQLPQGIHADKLLVLLSFGAVQGMLDPITPLGIDFFRLIVASINNKFFGRHFDEDTQPGLIIAGGRLFINVTQIIRSEIGRKFIQFIIPVGEPGSAASFELLFNDSRFAVVNKHLKARTILGIMRIGLNFFPNVAYNLLFPGMGRKRLKRSINKFVLDIKTKHDRATNLGQRAAIIDYIMKKLPKFFFTRLIPAVACGQVPLQLLLRMFEDVAGWKDTVMELTRGLPHNVTTEMDLMLWKTACVIKSDSSSLTHFSSASTESLIAEYEKGALPAVAQKAVSDFMNIYGARGLAEIDIGRPRWKENPAPLIQALTGYLQIDDSRSPESLFNKGAATAVAAKARLIELLKSIPKGKAKIHLVKLMSDRVRKLTGLRESPKFAAVRAITAQRDGFMQAGRELTASGVIDDPGGLFFLYVKELKSLASGEKRDWKSLVAGRRQFYDHEKTRRMIPRILLSDGTAFYEGMSALSSHNSNIITGSPVSAGITEGIVHVVFDPYKEQLLPGEILVCPGTDPSWTPLFLSARALVMEVGGMMTHGSVVAREYGIPAVVGVDQATTRLKTGQRIRVNGSNGQIEILE